MIIAGYELVTRILNHDVGFYYEEDYFLELQEEDAEYIREMIHRGYNQGELCYTDEEIGEILGWWEIV